MDKTSADVKFILFADNTTAFASENCVTSLATLTSEAKGKIKISLERNLLILNENKAQIIVFHRMKRA